MNTNAFALVALIAATAISGTVTTGTQFTGSTTGQLHALACAEPSKSNNPWNINNLYDCRTSTFYIPYQLWTGAKWDGTKDRNCSRSVDARGAAIVPVRADGTAFAVKGGTTETAGLACHEKGFGEAKAGAGKSCKFPAGHGWALSVKRDCADTAIEITSIKLNDRNELESIEFNWWNGKALQSRYSYAPDKGMTNSWGY